MHDGEIQTDEALVARLVAEQFPRWAGLNVARVPSSGTDNALYRLGGELLVRLPRIHWAVEAVHKEQHWLPKLAPQLPVAVPTPRAAGAPGQGYPWPWAIYDWLDGESPEPSSLADPVGFAGELAAFVTALRRVDTVGAPASARGVPLAERDADTRAAIAALRGMVDVDAVTDAWEGALAVRTWTGPPVWIHGDLAPGNLLCLDGHLRAVIDFGAAGIGDAACDMLIAWTLLPPSARTVYRTALAVDDDTWLRGRGWALSIAVIQLPYYRRTNPALAASARHVIGEVLADVRDVG